MGPGKCCSQAGHAYIQSFLVAEARRQQAYHQDGLGTKICLKVPSLETLLKYQEKFQALGFPHFLVEDTGNNSIFNGVPTITALGVGPLYPDECIHLKKLSLML